MEKLKSQQEMFSKIAPRYDLMNHLMTGWQDNRWRRYVIRQAGLKPGNRVLDLGTGTGKLSFEATKTCSNCQVVASDITLPMMKVGQQQIDQSNITWSAADAARLPFPEETFHAAVSGFLVRNLADLPAGLKEQFRVLKPGGRIVILDTTRTPDSILTPLIRIHLHHIIPTLGELLTGERDPYTYLPDTTENFLRPEEITAHLAAAGFRKINFRRFMFGMIAVLWGEK